MGLTQRDEFAVIVELPAVCVLETPVYGINAVRRFIRVVHALFVAEYFFAAPHERRTLRSEHYRLRKTGGTHALLRRAAGHGRSEFVGEHKVVVARHIIDYLCRR